ncbi:helix-turn-helix domain-containing protein [Asticcacaulis sp. YBE204]|uniref:helix-turn-helix domain-containing protein n=1 Tax=Asticcacaulis sp. YBE204 TaxID=1282363 RepID=UPI0003C3C98C|nr:helix-turn-helix transcriptional regulator [Asticcacaulis sp. YBE204]ESQ79168.1 Cro/Cl family transcriptional regulator [Asticcacaulis sp. YBE204]
MDQKGCRRTEDGATKAPHRVDVHVGSRVRIRRKFLGLSQQQLATRLAVTFQQIQKYERGSNRISASKLYDISSALKAPVTYFFDGLSEDKEAKGEMSIERSALLLLMSSEGIELAETFPRIKSAAQRQRVLDLVRVLLGEG